MPRVRASVASAPASVVLPAPASPHSSAAPGRLAATSSRKAEGWRSSDSRAMTPGARRLCTRQPYAQALRPSGAPGATVLRLAVDREARVRVDLAPARVEAHVELEPRV